MIGAMGAIMSDTQLTTLAIWAAFILSILLVPFVMVGVVATMGVLRHRGRRVEGLRLR
jgi:hypothetical protein